ncbi:bifunctional diguanylate cyclase/phosphodiesterase [Aureimonas endophytica]|uniref:Bifunctional diguanylate cyclase/phosphodiesterase n=1 Tax=Aureimonas endophytica TaxID=2027858 RepID=A0A916ZFS6_9HYPH|nr:EAL domain-containing protein [Aureimonas endophytica]GGD95377.1 bifunctional diguanylate cyclase/phosphodiesterase [Aureimonas endophytica]
MVSFLAVIAASHSIGFVVAAAIICLSSAWLLASLLPKLASLQGRVPALWFGTTAVVAGMGVWTTHFMAMLGYRPDIALGYDLETTLLSAAIAVAFVGIPLAVSAVKTSLVLRTLLGALAGLGIGAMHLTGMGAIVGCLQSSSLEADLIACFAAAILLAVARGLPDRFATPPTTCTLFTLAVCAAHFISISGTSISPLLTGRAEPHQNITLSIFTGAGAVVLLLGAFLTLMAARRFEAQERAHSSILSTALENMSNGLLYFDRNHSLQLYNRRYREIFALGGSALKPGMSRKEIIDVIGDTHGWDAARRRLATRRADEWLAPETSESFEYLMDDGRIMEIEVRPVAAGGAVLIFDDVTDMRRAHDQISQLAYHDVLTKLPNRRSLQMRLDEAFRARRNIKLLLLDLDRFKAVNDTFGHGVGDRLLVAAAERLREAGGSAGFVARLGGDEMALVVNADQKQAVAIAQAVVDAIAEPFLIDRITVRIGCSIGICCADEAEDAEQLMQRADIALYEAKRAGRGRVACYRPGMVEEVAERHRLEEDMRQALARGEFHLAYQPIMALASGEITGYEALIRWRHPTEGEISPARFIPLAEENGLVVEIGEWVLRQACRDAATWPAGRHVAVNVSTVQFRTPLLLKHITSALAESGLSPNRLEVELTETAIVADGAQIADGLAALRALGIRIAMDDFGTGYSSLAHLRDFPLDRIKIDRSFVSNALADRHSMAVLKAVIRMGEEMEISTIAEGVESEAEFTLLRELGCSAAQGYYIGRPAAMPAGEQDARRVGGAGAF